MRRKLTIVTATTALAIAATVAGIATAQPASAGVRCIVWNIEIRTASTGTTSTAAFAADPEETIDAVADTVLDTTDETFDTIGDETGIYIKLTPGTPNYICLWPPD